MFESKAMLRNFASSLAFSIVGTAAAIVREEQLLTAKLDAIKDGITDGEIVSAIDAFNEHAADLDDKAMSAYSFEQQGSEERLASRNKLTLLVTLRRKIVEELSAKPNLTQYDKPTTVKQAFAEMLGLDPATLQPRAMVELVTQRLERISRRNIVVDGEVKPYIDGMCEVIGIPESVFVTLTRKRIAKELEQLRELQSELQAIVDDANNVTVGHPVLAVKEPTQPETSTEHNALLSSHEAGHKLTRAQLTKLKRCEAEHTAAMAAYDLEYAEYKRARDKYAADMKRYNAAMQLRDDVDSSGNPYDALDALGILANMPPTLRLAFFSKFDKWLADAKGRLAQYGERMGMATLLQEAATLKLDAAVIAQLGHSLSAAVEIE